VNKTLFSEHHFRAFFLLTTGQLLASIFFSLLCSNVFPTIVQLRPLTLQLAKKIAPLSMVNSLNAVLGFAGLRLVNIPMFLVLRRITTPIVLLFEYFCLKKVASSLVMKAVAIAVVGTLVAGSSDLTFDLFGYLFTFANNFSTATYLILIKVLGANTGPDALSSFELLFFNSLMSLPFLAFLAWYTEQVSSFFALDHSFPFLVLFFLSCVMGFIFNFVIFMCTSVNSPLATSVTGNIKDCLATLLGYLLFKDVVLQLVNVCGVLISLVGGIVYSYAKLKESGKLGSKTTAYSINYDSSEEACFPELSVGKARESEKAKLISTSADEGANAEP